MFQLYGLVHARTSTIGADDPNVRHKDVANGDARAAAAAHSDRVPIVKDSNVGDWKDRERQILKVAGLVAPGEPEHVPIGMVNAGIERPHPFLAIIPATNFAHLPHTELQ